MKIKIREILEQFGNTKPILKSIVVDNNLGEDSLNELELEVINKHLKSTVDFEKLLDEEVSRDSIEWWGDEVDDINFGFTSSQFPGIPFQLICDATERDVVITTYTHEYDAIRNLIPEEEMKKELFMAEQAKWLREVKEKQDAICDVVFEVNKDLAQVLIDLPKILHGAFYSDDPEEKAYHLSPLLSISDKLNDVLDPIARDISKEINAQYRKEKENEE